MDISKKKNEKNFNGEPLGTGDPDWLGRRPTANLSSLGHSSIIYRNPYPVTGVGIGIKNRNTESNQPTTYTLNGSKSNF